MSKELTLAELVEQTRRETALLMMPAKIVPKTKEQNLQAKIDKLNQEAEIYQQILNTIKETTNGK